MIISEEENDGGYRDYKLLVAIELYLLDLLVVRQLNQRWMKWAFSIENENNAIHLKVKFLDEKDLAWNIIEDGNCD